MSNSHPNIKHKTIYKILGEVVYTNVNIQNK